MRVPTFASILAAVAIAACSARAPSTHAPPAASISLVSPRLGIKLTAPGDARLTETANHAFFGNGSFKLNVFTVDDYSVPSADAQKDELSRMPGFVKVTREDRQGDRWRFDYELVSGQAGTIARVRAGSAFDCGVHGVTPQVAAAVAEACAGIEPL